MAIRPVFIPKFEEGRLVEEVLFDFPWASGFAEIQKKMNILALHKKAKENGLNRVLEISTKSDKRVGRHLSAFSLQISIGDQKNPLESVYQGCKVFETGGPHPKIFSFSPRDAKRFIRVQQLGKMIGFEFEGTTYPLSPKNAFYDWIYIRSLEDHADWIMENVDYEGFTDIEFNPAKQVNCQARAFAEFLSLKAKSKLSRASSDFHYFASLLSPI